MDRDAAEALKGARISIPRRYFPVTDDDEFYWVDLIGLAVENEAGEAFGTIDGLMETGAHQNLLVRTEGSDGKTVERLIPFVDAFVKTVDLAGRRVVVDWQSDY